MNEKKHIKAGLLSIAMAIFALIVITVIYCNRVFLRDFFRGLAYQPTSEMIALKVNLGLTNDGDLIFKSSWPELEGKEEFNEHCRTVETTTAILGCYTNETICIYDITDKRLDGIREATLAHELLHAVYARLSEAERNGLKPYLDEVYNKNKDILGDELKIYAETEQYEELYVRAGTEIKDLPEELEKHFARYFKDQDVIAGYYNKYASVFKDLDKQIKELKKELDQKYATIESMKTEYEQRLANLNADISEFNSCAATAGCFSSEWEFYVKRNELLAEKDALLNLYEEINDLVASYNEMVSEYNKNIIYSQALNNAINSTAAPVEID
ncbi:hypothetical protein IKF12_02345 [Candidatus Saccharibacteria bacterium]|nr:hypothetical protein [Candidatus Saccharibacteria bacterium]